MKIFGLPLNVKRKRIRENVTKIGLPRIVFSHVVIAMINKMDMK